MAAGRWAAKPMAVQVADPRVPEPGKQATDLLRQNDFDAHNMQCVMNSWAQAGLDLEK